MEHRNMRRSYNKQGGRASLSFSKLEAPSQPEIKYVDASLPTVNPWFKDKTAQHNDQSLQQASEEAMLSKSCNNSCNDNFQYKINNGRKDEDEMESNDKNTTFDKFVESANLDQYESEAVSRQLRVPTRRCPYCVHHPGTRWRSTASNLHSRRKQRHHNYVIILVRIILIKITISVMVMQDGT